MFELVKGLAFRIHCLALVDFADSAVPLELVINASRLLLGSMLLT